MTDIQSYRQYAADCVKQAQVEPTANHRDILLNVALAWLRLARQTEVQHTEGWDTEGRDFGDWNSGNPDAADEMPAGPARSEAFRELAS